MPKSGKEKHQRSCDLWCCEEKLTSDGFNSGLASCRRFFLEVRPWQFCAALAAFARGLGVIIFGGGLALNNYQQDQGHATTEHHKRRKNEAGHEEPFPQFHKCFLLSVVIDSQKAEIWEPNKDQKGQAMITDRPDYP